MNGHGQVPPQIRPHMPSEFERRAATRYPGRNRMAWVGWWDGDGEDEARFVTSPAWILDISQNGMFLETSKSPSRDEIWLSIIVETPSDWLPADVVEVRHAVDDPLQYRIRVATHQPLPYDLFKVVILGSEIRSDLDKPVGLE